MKKIIISFAFFLFVALIGSILYFSPHAEIPVLNPKGLIADKQRSLLIVATILMLVVVIPAFIMTFIIPWKYRASNKKAKFTPEWSHSTLAEVIWWGGPFCIIIVLSIITWRTSHELNPFKKIESDKKALPVQVVALQWKWLFIYPEQKIASLNFLRIPEKTPINFSITSDAPMNSFWIPQLGGQMYAMPGMDSKLHLIADTTGMYRGASANISGEGFADMCFFTEAMREEDFNEWVKTAQNTKNILNNSTYTELIAPSKNLPRRDYILQEENLYNYIVMKYMIPQ